MVQRFFSHFKIHTITPLFSVSDFDDMHVRLVTKSLSWAVTILYMACQGVS